MHWRSVHLVVGIAGVIAFLVTGQYMQWAHNGLQGMADGPRIFFRSAHIYLLWTSLLNLVLGRYLIRVQQPVRRYVQALGSLAVVTGPFLLCLSFFVEQHNPGLLRPVGQLAIYLALAGVLLHAFTFDSTSG
jgi:hypothetical protein